MPVVIKRIIDTLESNRLHVEVLHNDQVLEVFLFGTPDSVKALLGKEVTFEMDYEKVLSWRTTDLVDYSDSGLFKNADNSVLVKGIVCNIIQTDDDTIIDIYVENGAEFITVLSSEIDKYVPNIDGGIEVCLKGLCIYPNYY